MKKLYNTSAPSIIWRIDCLTDAEKIVLFNACHYLKSSKNTLDIWLLSYMSGKDKSEVSQIYKNLHQKGFIINNNNKRYLNWKRIEDYATERDFIKENETPVEGNFIGYVKDSIQENKGNNN